MPIGKERKKETKEANKQDAQNKITSFAAGIASAGMAKHRSVAARTSGAQASRNGAGTSTDVSPAAATSEAAAAGRAAAAVASSEATRKRIGPKRAALDWLAMLVGVTYLAWIVYYYTADVLPNPLSEAVAGKRGFSEERAYRHVRKLSELGPHPVGSDALQRAVQYVLDQVLEVQEEANADVAVDVDYFHSQPGLLRLTGALFNGKTLVYSGLKHVVVRIGPKYDESASLNSILVSSHIDTVVTTGGAGDCSSCVGLMLELVRTLSNWAHGFKHSVIFLFNTGEEEGLTGAHSFITQHPWSETIRAAVDLESMGVGGKHYLFQGGPDSWLVEVFAKVAKQPAALAAAQDIFHSGLVKSATDFQIYREVAGLSGLDFAYMDNAVVYHSRNDKLALLRPGSLQHSGDNLLPFLREVATLPDLAVRNSTFPNEFSNMEVVYFDILGWYMVTYSKYFAKVLHQSIIYQGLVLFLSSLCLTGVTGFVALGLAVLAIYLTWTFAIGFTLLVAMIVPYLTSFALPFIASPWMVIGLYGAPALCGALLGHRFGRDLLVSYLADTHVKIIQRKNKETPDQGTQEIIAVRAQSLAQWEAERWLFKAGILQWMLVLGLGTWVKAGSSYLALAWVVGPTVAYGVIETQFSPKQSLRELHRLTFWLGMLIPSVLTAFPVIRTLYMLICLIVNFDRNPGGLPEWSGSVMVGAVVAVVVCLMFVYLLPYAHRSGGFKWILGAVAMLAIVTLGLLALSIFPAFTTDIGRAINVVHVIDTNALEGDQSSPRSYVSLSSLTMGRLDEEAKFMNDTGLVCGRSDGPDFANYVVRYGCKKTVPLQKDLWNNRPLLEVVSDDQIDGCRQTSIHLSTGASHRWFLAVNTDKIERLKLETLSQAEGPGGPLVPVSDITGVNGWHQVQYISESTGPHKFVLTLYWSKDSSRMEGDSTSDTELLKLRTDVNSVTAEAAAVFEKLPEWCVSFGKSTAPYSLAYLAGLDVQFGGARVKHSVV